MILNELFMIDTNFNRLMLQNWIKYWKIMFLGLQPILQLFENMVWCRPTVGKNALPLHAYLL